MSGFHSRLEAQAILFSVLTFLAVAVGGLVLLIPPYYLQGTIEAVAGVTPYSALELEGRDIYIREGCNTCHSQQVRPFKNETDRYGPFSLSGEGIYDRPFLWGSRRTGPDLARVGGKYPHSWHWYHFRSPRDVEPRSNMPDFAFLYDTELDLSLSSRKLEVLSGLGHPYTEDQIQNATRDAERQADGIVAQLRAEGVEIGEAEARSEILAMIAYMQKLGTAISRPAAAALDGRTVE